MVAGVGSVAAGLAPPNENPDVAAGAAAGLAPNELAVLAAGAGVLDKLKRPPDAGLVAGALIAVEFAVGAPKENDEELP